MRPTGDPAAKADYDKAIVDFNAAKDALNDEWKPGEQNPSKKAWELLQAMDEPRNRLVAARDRYFGV